MFSSQLLKRMTNSLRHIKSWLLVAIMAIALGGSSSYALASNLHLQLDTTKSNLTFSQLASLAGKSKRSTKEHLEELDRAITNVKVFYNPVAEQISVSFKLAKDNLVTIKVMDALGNEVMSLLNENLDGGTQSLSFDTNSKLQPGFYFVRVNSGTESVIKRISIR